MNGSTAVGSATPGATLGQGIASIKNLKQVTVSEAVNGFVVATQKIDSYGQDMHVAKDENDVLEIIKTYFTN